VGGSGSGVPSGAPRRVILSASLIWLLRPRFSGERARALERTSGSCSDDPLGRAAEREASSTGEAPPSSLGAIPVHVEAGVLVLVIWVWASDPRASDPRSGDLDPRIAVG
jgi:hypothetical protein